MRELKAKKAKHGFTDDYFSATELVPYGMLIAALNARFDTVKFEYTIKCNGGQMKFFLYTDHDDVAAYVRERMKLNPHESST